MNKSTTSPFSLGDIISYLEMCREEGVNLQRVMNYRVGGAYSVILMSIKPDAPYADRIEDDGRVLIYEGHDVPQKRTVHNPKAVDQPMHTPKGSLTQNGLFYNAAQTYLAGKTEPEVVKAYEKIHPDIWTFNGFFKLVDAWLELSNARKVFKFRLEFIGDDFAGKTETEDLEHGRVIPAAVKLHVWKRDRGRCVICGSADNLHFDPIIPYAKGGSSLVAENIQLLCAGHNLERRDRTE